MRHILSILVENEAGALSRISGLLRTVSVRSPIAFRTIDSSPTMSPPLSPPPMKTADEPRREEGFL